eukprot:scaffold853_cov386-Prasinococcus_capsulatus_cf.AAC.27
MAAGRAEVGWAPRAQARPPPAKGVRRAHWCTAPLPAAACRSPVDRRTDRPYGRAGKYLPARARAPRAQRGGGEKRTDQFGVGEAAVRPPFRCRVEMCGASSACVAPRGGWRRARSRRPAQRPLRRVVRTGAAAGGRLCAALCRTLAVGRRGCGTGGRRARRTANRGRGKEGDLDIM